MNATPPCPATYLISERPVEFVEGRTYCWNGIRHHWYRIEDLGHVYDTDTHWCHSDTRPTHDPNAPTAPLPTVAPHLAGLVERLEHHRKFAKEVDWKHELALDLTDAIAALTQLAPLAGEVERLRGNLSMEHDRANALGAQLELSQQKLAAAERDADALAGCSEVLTAKLHSLPKDDRYMGVWACYANHGGKYDGPFYVDELDAADKALSDHRARGAAGRKAT